MNYSKSLKTKSFEKITKNHPNLTKWVVSLVRLEGFEPATFWFVAKHSIQLSYSRNSFRRGLSPDGLISIAQKRIFGKCFFKKFFFF